MGTSTLRRSDYLLLVGFVALVFCVPLAVDRVLGNHETVHCQNIREMRTDGDWVIPHYGGRPWLERPPLPFWLTMPLVSLFGDTTRVYRLASILAGLPTVLLTGWMAGLFFGRAAGLLAGCIVATMHEFVRYAIAPEADIFVCSLVAIGQGLFVHLEFQRRPDDRGSFVGARPWAVLALFAVLGLGNITKGLFFANLFLLVPIALFLLLAPGRWAHIKRYVWLWGWLMFAACASAWAVSAYLRQPDIVDLWGSDYLGRINRGYMREPAWYYLPHLLLNLAPWTPVALLGLWLTRGKAWSEARSPERFLWFWAVAPVLVLSIPQGKHHHYLLSITAPWAVLAAVGILRLRQHLTDQEWLRRPYVALGAASVAAVAGVLLAGYLVPVVRPWVPALLVACPAVLVGGWLSAVQRDTRTAFALLLGLVVAGHWSKELVVWVESPGLRGDLAFVRETQRRVPANAPLLVLDTWGPLDASWSLFYFEGRAKLLHNISFLREARLVDREVYVVSRSWLMTDVGRYGACETVLTSEKSRNEKSPADRLTLYRVRLHDGLVLHREPVYISPMQATGRAEGPYLP